MLIKLVADSSANLHTMDCDIPYSSVPLKIVAGDKEYVDNTSLDIQGMLNDLREHKGKSGTACPSIGDWLEAFGDADIVYGVAITSQLSGCYNAAQLAAEEYMEANPGKKVFILDSLSTGPEMELILEKYLELIHTGKEFEEVCEEIKKYCTRTQLLFSLESLTNLARNGRVSPAVAAVAGILGIRLVGRASDHGTLEPMHKPRGEKKALQQLLTSMQEMGYTGGKVRISHTFNEETAHKLAELIRSHHPGCDLKIRLNSALCCFYAEDRGLLLGFEA